MSLKVYPLVLFYGCIIILHVFDTSAQYPPSDASSFVTGLNQQPIYTAFPASTSPASTTTSLSSLQPAPAIPNAFTQAALASPILQRYFNLRIPRLQAANLFLIVISDQLRDLGSPAPATIASIVGQAIAGLKEFTIPQYFQLKGRAVEKLLISEGIEIVPSLAQSFANSMEKAFESSILNSNKAIIKALDDGLINFIQSIGIKFIEKAYILALLVYEEVYPISLKSLN